MADQAYDHLVAKGIEGFEMTGYVPGGNSGVTIGGGVDLKFQEADRLKRYYKVPSGTIDKLKPYLGKKGSEVANPSTLKLSKEEAKPLTMAFVNKHLEIIEDEKLNQKMTQRGTNVLVSMRHYLGHLGNLPPMWDAIKGKSATDADLRAALVKARDADPVRRSRIDREIQHLDGRHD